MKKYLVIAVMLCSTLAVLAQKNEISIVLSGDIFEPVYNDYLPDDQQFSLGLEYSKSLGKRFRIETGLMYSKSGFTINQCNLCDGPFYPGYKQTKELNAKIGLRWEFIAKEKFGLYTSAGIQGNRKLNPNHDFEIPEEDHLSGAAYQDLGIRFKLGPSFSLDFEFKGRYNLPDQTGLYYNKSKIKLGAGIGFNYSF